MASHTVIALDVGHSAVKAFATNDRGTARFIMPSVVCRAFPISDENEARRAAAETVRVGGTPYFVGETALYQGGGHVTGLSENWIETDEHVALILGMIKKIRDAGYSIEKPELVVGLPTSLFSQQKNKLAEIILRHVDYLDIKVIPQSMGPFFSMMIQESGMPALRGEDESWAVVEVGFFTTDFMLAKRRRWIENCSGVCSGVRVATEHLQRSLKKSHNITLDSAEAETALLSGEVRSFGKTVDVKDEAKAAISVIVNDVVNKANELLESEVRKLDGVLVAGGGAALVFEQLLTMWPHAQLVEDPRFAVAEGMRRIGIARSLTRSEMAVQAGHHQSDYQQSFQQPQAA